MLCIPIFSDINTYLLAFLNAKRAYLVLHRMLSLFSVRAYFSTFLFAREGVVSVGDHVCASIFNIFHVI